MQIGAFDIKAIRVKAVIAKQAVVLFDEIGRGEVGRKSEV